MQNQFFRFSRVFFLSLIDEESDFSPFFSVFCYIRQYVWLTVCVCVYVVVDGYNRLLGVSKFPKVQRLLPGGGCGGGGWFCRCVFFIM